MALGTCGTCGHHPLSTDKAECPNCGEQGFPARKDDGVGVAGIVAIAAGVILLAAVAPKDTNGRFIMPPKDPSIEQRYTRAAPAQQCYWRWDRRYAGRIFSHREFGAPYFVAPGIVSHPYKDVYIDRWQKVPVWTC
ncbi:MAG: hypothetical protein WBW81_16625 [Methylocella sp.]